MAELSPTRGVAMLVRDAVEHGSRLVERVQRGSVALPLTALEVIPALAPAVRRARLLHDGWLRATHGGIRFAGRVLYGLVVALEDRRAAGPSTTRDQSAP